VDTATKEQEIEKRLKQEEEEEQLRKEVSEIGITVP
jgi:hypothetical protein